MSSNPWLSDELEDSNKVTFSPDPAVTALTFGFDDNFVEKWAGTGGTDKKEELANSAFTGLEEDFALDEEDAVFKTVPGKIVLSVSFP